MIKILSIVYSLLLFTSTVSPTQVPFLADPNSNNHSLIPSSVITYAESLLASHNSSGLAIAVVLRDPTSNAGTGFRTSFASFGTARADRTPVTPDTLFAIASNSKLFTALTVGLLIANETLRKDRGVVLDWNTKAASVLPGWGLKDEDADREVTLLDMLVHRTGMPRHDFAGQPWDGGVQEMVATLPSLRPSASFRSTFQYNNMMYEALTLLPRVLLNQSFESYVAQHIFTPLGMNSTTYSVVEAESQTYHGKSNRTHSLAHGFQRHLRDFYNHDKGVLRPTAPYFQRPGAEHVWAGAGGILTSTHDLSKWLALLMNSGVHPYTNATLIPPVIFEHLTRGVSVSEGKASYPEWSPKVYAPAQWRYTYRGHELLEHGGSNPGFKTQVARFINLGPIPEMGIHKGALKDFPNATALGIIALSNDGDGSVVLESVKWRIVDELLGLEPIDWYDRYVKEQDTYYASKRAAALPRPAHPAQPPAPLEQLEGRAFEHPAYGRISFCFVPPGAPGPSSNPHPYPYITDTKGKYTNKTLKEDSHCPALLSHPTTKLILAHTPVRDVPTLISEFARTFATHLRMTHWSGPWFNVTVVWGNQGTPGEDGKKREEGDEGMLIGLDERFEVEWVGASAGGREVVGGEGEEGLAFRGGIWGMEGDARAPEGMGKEGAEVWFKRVL